MDDLCYPIGKHAVLAPVDDATWAAAVEDIEALPRRLRAVVAGLDDAQLDTPYRPGGWTVRQLVHHVGDSHLNAVVRLRLALSEEEPTIRPYDEAVWAELPDARTLALEPSLRLLEGLHARWSALLGTVDAAQRERTLRHPEIGTLTVGQLMALYGWHSRHHVAHVERLRVRAGWSS